jgi:hypothetical protein
VDGEPAAVAYCALSGDGARIVHREPVGAVRFDHVMPDVALDDDRRVRAGVGGDACPCVIERRQQRGDHQH